MIVVFIHQNFPGQYRHLAQHLAAQPGNTVYFVTQPNANHMPGVQKLVYQLPPVDLVCHPYVTEIDVAVRRGLQVAKILRQLQANGVKPDIVIGHNGWGETLFVKDVFPSVPLLAYFEFFYQFDGIDVGFDAEYPALDDDRMRLRMRNTTNLNGLHTADWGHTATAWQRELYPPEQRARISVLHEGIDTALSRPDPGAWLQLQNDLRLSSQDEVITYVARNLEPYRGFHVLMRALPELLRRRPKAQVLIVGGDEVSYGRQAPDGLNYREYYLREAGADIDLSRVHFLGKLPHHAFVNVLQVSSVHVYLTYPFVLSWSFIEAMAAGCLVIGSSNRPVTDVLKHGENGLLTDFFSPTQLCDRIDEVFAHPDRMADLRAAARKLAIRDYDLTRTLPGWLELIGDLIAGRSPDPLRWPGKSKRSSRSRIC